MRQERRERLSANPTSLMRRRHSDLVHPQFGRLIGMNVVERRRHRHHQPIVNGDRQMVTWIGKKLRAPARVYRIVEHVWRDMLEDHAVALAQGYGC